MLRRQLLKGSALVGMAGVVPELAGAQARPNKGTVLNVLDYGASGTETRSDTSSIQAAINACAGAGGGTVLFPPGRYLTGTLFLRDHVGLRLSDGATLLGSTNLADYPPRIPSFRATTGEAYTERSLIYGEKLENIFIEGRGTVDGQGMHFDRSHYGRPYLIRFSECRSISVRGITLKNSGMWVQHYLACTQVLIDGIRVRSHVNVNNDGIDIDGCDRVRISNCDIDSGDDAVVLKSGGQRITRNVTVTNCVLRSSCNALKTGTESNGGFENIAFSNCVVRDTQLAGIALEIVDGGTLNGVVMSNITMSGVGAPLFIRLGNRARPVPPETEGQPTGSISNILIDNIFATRAGETGCSITGLPGHPVRDVSLSNVRLVFAGGGKREDALRPVLDKPEAYPEFNMFGALPAYGFYCRHVMGLRFSNVQTAFANLEERPALFCDDVDDLDISTAHFSAVEGGAPSLALREARNVMTRGCRADRQPVFLSVKGSSTHAITLLGNDLHLAATAVTVGEDVKPGAVFAVANRESGSN